MISDICVINNAGNVNYPFLPQAWYECRCLYVVTVISYQLFYMTCNKLYSLTHQAQLHFVAVKVKCIHRDKNKINATVSHSNLKLEQTQLRVTEE